MNPMELNAVRDKCLSQAEKLGWHDPEHPVPVPEMVALLHSECSEMLEAYRKHEPLSWTDEKGKPQGMASELADIIVRVGHYAGALGVDLEYEVKRKLTYNLTRGYRHGGLAA